MGKRTICPLTCPMINSQGFCESAWTRAAQGTESRADRLPEMVLSALSVFAL